MIRGLMQEIRRSLRPVKLFRHALAVIAVSAIFLLSSCVTLVTDALTNAVLGYTSDEITANMKTLDPTASYSKRSAIFLKLMGDEEKMESLQRKYPSLVSKVLSPNRKNTYEISIPIEGGGEIRGFLVFPLDKDRYKKYPVVIYAHGGGFTSWNFEKFKTITGNIADNTDSCVLFYEYRLAPEFKFPCGVNDTFDTYKWVMDEANAEKWHLDNSRLVFMGDSSGGNFMAGLSIRLAENDLPNAKGVCLLYPSLDVSQNLNFSRIAFSGIEDPDRYYVTSLEYLASVMKDYLESPEDAYKPYASPFIMLEGLIDVEGFDNQFKPYRTKLEPPLPLPPHFIGVPAVDALRDEGKGYYAMLKAFGVDASIHEYSGVFHGFAMMDVGIYKAKLCLEDCYAFIRKCFE